MSYIVTLAQNSRKRETYWPEGEDEICDRETAEKRHADLVRLGAAGETIEGVKIFHVATRDVTTGELVLSQYPGEPAQGPWATLN
jgi:hypothetical protein